MPSFASLRGGGRPSPADLLVSRQPETVQPLPPSPRPGAAGPPRVGRPLAPGPPSRPLVRAAADYGGAAPDRLTLRMPARVAPSSVVPARDRKPAGASPVGWRCEVLAARPIPHPRRPAGGGCTDAHRGAGGRGRAAGLLPVLGGRAPRRPGHRVRSAGGAACGDRGAHGGDPARIGRSDAAQPPATHRGGAVPDAGGSLPGQGRHRTGPLTRLHRTCSPCAAPP